MSERPSGRLDISRSIEVDTQKGPDCYLTVLNDINDIYAQILMLLIEMERLRSIDRAEEQCLFQLDFVRLLMTLSTMTRADTGQGERVRIYISENIQSR